MPLGTYVEFAATSQTGGSIREDLLNEIENISPRDTPLFNSLGSVKIQAGFVEWLVDSFRARAANAFGEGVAATDVNLTTPTRRSALVQNMQVHYHVAGRTQAVNHAGMANMLAYQATKAMVHWKNDLEHALHRGSAVTGNTNVSPQFAGMLNVLSTNFTASSGTTFSEFVLNSLLALAYQNTTNVREFFSGITLKRGINQFTSTVQRYLPAGDKRQLELVNVKALLRALRRPSGALLN